MKEEIKTPKLSDFKQDEHNANSGTQRGADMIRASLEKYGTGRSILVDADGTILAGNKTAQNAVALGLEDVIVVPSDGKKLIVVQRTDLKAGDSTARELAIADNRTAEVSLNWNVEELVSVVDDPNIDMSAFFTEGEMKDLTAEPIAELEEKTVELKPQSFVRVLVSIPLESAHLAREYLDALGKIDKIEVDYGAN